MRSHYAGATLVAMGFTGNTIRARARSCTGAMR